VNEPEHITDGRPCWCNPEVQGSVIVHRTLTEVAYEMREKISQALGGEDPGGDYRYWMGLVRSMVIK